MLKRILTVLALGYAAACFSALDVNTATGSALDSIKDVGPAMSSQILDERKKSKVKDWPIKKPVATGLYWRSVTEDS